MSKILSQTLSRTLIAKRDELELTQERTAEKLKVAVRTYQHWETGGTLPNSANLLNILFTLDIDLIKFKQDLDNAGYIFPDKYDI